MLAIINYDRENAQNTSEILNHFEIPNFVTSCEKDIYEASGVILPHTNDIKLALRKLQLTNLYNFLKIINKPVLGIGNGSLLMLKNIKDKKFAGFGFFKGESLAENEVLDGDLSVLEDSSLLDCKFIKQNSDIRLPKLIFDCDKTVKYQVNCNGTSMPLVFEIGKYYGILLPIVQKSLLAKQLFSKFANLNVSLAS